MNLKDMEKKIHELAKAIELIAEANILITEEFESRIKLLEKKRFWQK